MLAHIKRADRARRRRLRLHAERADARAEGRRALRQPVARARVQAGRVPRAVRAPLRATSTCSASSTRASCARTRSRSSASAGTACTRALRFTKPFYDRFTPAISARDFTLPARRPGQAASTCSPCCGHDAASASSCTPTCPTWRASGRGRSARSGCGRRSRPRYLPLLDVLDAHPGEVTLSITPVLADQLEAPGALERCLAFLREIRPASHGLDAVDHPEAAAQIAYSAARYESAAEALERRGDLIAAFAPARHVDERRHPRRAAAAGHRRRRAAAARDRDRVAPAPLRRLGRRLLAARVRARAVARRAARGGGRAHDLRRLDRRDRRRPRPQRRPRPGRSWSRSTAPRSTASGTSAATRRHGDYRDSNRLTPRAHALWANDGSLYDPARAAERAREPTPASSSPPCPTAPSSPSTPSSSATTGTRASRSCRRCSSWPTWCRSRSRARRPLRPTRRRRAGASRRDLRTWSRGELAWTQRSAELAALGGRSVRPRAARAARAAELRLGVPDRRAAPPATTRASGLKRITRSFIVGTCRTKFRRTAQFGS